MPRGSTVNSSFTRQVIRVASVDTASCQTSGEGFADLCAVWVDDDFDPAEQAYYYTRVVENPSCRWSQRMCAAAKVDCAKPETIGEGYAGCCAQEHRPVIQERAWSSPIWYRPVLDYSPADLLGQKSTSVPITVQWRYWDPRPTLLFNGLDYPIIRQPQGGT